MDIELKQILDKYEINHNDFLENINKSLEANINSYPNLSSRQSKYFYKDLSFYYSNKNKTTKSLLPLNAYFEYSHKSEIYYKMEEPEVNQILEGGFKSGYVYKIIGSSGTGKTSLLNSLVKANKNNKNIKMIYFSFLYDNVDYELEKYSELYPSSNFTLVNHIGNFKELISGYFKDNGEKLRKYNIIIFDPFTILLHRGINIDNALISFFAQIINDLTQKYNICVIFGLNARKLSNTFWYYQNDQKQIDRLILRNYDNVHLNQHFPNCVQIYLYKMQKHKILKYYIKVLSSNYLKTSNFTEWELASLNSL